MQNSNFVFFHIIKIIENEDVPLTRTDLKMKSLTENIDYEDQF